MNNLHEEETFDRLDWFIVGLLLGALLLAAVFGHSAVSTAYGQAEGMPILYADTFLPSVSK